jgi:hypothetical protein
MRKTIFDVDSNWMKNEKNGERLQMEIGKKSSNF